MRHVIRTMALVIFMTFVIQPSAEAEVVSGSYWQKLPDALHIHNVQFMQSVQLWNATIRWNEAYQEALNKAAEQKTPKTQQQPKVVSDVVSQSGDKFDRLSQCESGGNPSTNTGNGYYGAFQFTLSTWKAVGGSGLPSDHSYGEQKQKAKELANRASPGSQWPVCWAKTR